MTFPTPVRPVRGSVAESVRSNVCAAFKRRTVSSVTVTSRVALALPDPFDAVRRTVKVPAAAYTCVAFCCVDEWPSPKSHAHADGAPADVSENWTSEPAAGLGVDAENDAVGAAVASVPEAAASHERATTERPWKKTPRVFMKRG